MIVSPRPFPGTCYLGHLIPVVRLLLVALFLAAGILHLRDPDLFLPLMPPWIPFHQACILLSGVCEILGAIGLLLPWRTVELVAGWGLVLLLIAVFPANLHMALSHVRVHGFPAKPWMAWARLPLQPILIVAVLWVTRAWSGICIKKGK